MEISYINWDYEKMDIIVNCSNPHVLHFAG